MIFVTGGYQAGKRQFVIDELGYTQNDLSFDIVTDSKVLYNLQDIYVTDIDQTLQLLKHKEVIICNELGCGVVPIDKDLRRKRDLIGKLCVEIAKKADEVYRVYSGIGVKIK